MLLAGISTAVLEGGDGPPVMLLHGPMGNATHWMGIIPELVATHRVIAPDLPGHGASEVTGDGGSIAGRIMEWLHELIDQSCEAPPALVGHLLGGAIAARFASDRATGSVGSCSWTRSASDPSNRHRSSGSPCRIFSHNRPSAPTRTSGATVPSTWTLCANAWASSGQPFEAYNLDRARAPSVQAAVGTLMELFGVPAISSAGLARIKSPTTLIWGRHDARRRFRCAEEASTRFGWPLHVIEDCNDDPPVEQPEALLRALRVAFAGV